MPVFKLFFKIIKANFPRFIVSLFIFILLATLINQTTKEQFTDQFEIKKAKITIFDKDHSSRASQSLIHYLGERTEIIEIENSPEAISDAFFDRRINYALTIPEGFEEHLLNPDFTAITLKKESHNSIMDEIRVDSLIESFMFNASTLAASLPTTLNQNALNQYFMDLEKNLDQEIEIISGHNVIETSKIISFGLLFLPMILYFTMMNFINNFGYVEMAMRQEDIIRRERNSLLKESSRLKQTVLATSCYTIGFWIILICLAYLFYGSEAFSSQRSLLFLLSSFVATLGIQAMAYFIGVLAPNKGVVNFLGNLLSLVLAYGSGIFIDISLIPKELQFIASIATPIWSVKANYIIAESTYLSDAIMDDYWEIIGIQLLITIAYWSMALLIKKFTQEKNYLITT
ncbi:ABC transporter permease [Facklamia sp. 7083-14-GEN3]|uniref:ABC transporter permease n=1 Tax=Facklamia sp. 7083-14-GEN3 TaxID=2973478 RepID=UPI00215CB4DD|nr:ABC transporter permease [Facklamia sp. 7083-14-GEN3]MCR8968615.1 ABC transporter permease [Facklamia sp. 7083-14-GEN3]